MTADGDDDGDEGDDGTEDEVDQEGARAWTRRLLIWQSRRVEVGSCRCVERLDLQCR